MHTIERTWPDALDEFDHYLRGLGRHRYATRKSHLSHLRTLAERVPAGPAAVGELEISGWLDARGASRRNAWNAARVFYQWAERAGLVASSPIPEAAPRRRVLVQREIPVRWVEPFGWYVDAARSRGQSVRSIEVRLAFLRQLARSFPDPWAVSYADLVGWLAGHEQWAPETRRGALTAVRGFYAEAVRRGALEVSPATDVARIRVPRAFPRPAARETVGTALANATDRDALMVLLGAFAGLRAAEIAAVRPSTDVQEGWLYVRGKGQHARRIPLHPIVAAAIDAELARRRDGRHGTGWRSSWSAGAYALDGYLFPSADGSTHVTPDAVVRRLSKILPGRATAHTLRHRFASEAYAGCLDIRAVQELLGHASPATTARYTAVPSSTLVAAVQGLR